MRLVCLSLVAGLSVLLSACQQPQNEGDTTEVYFSPNGGCVDAILRRLRNASTSVYVQAYSFTSAPIAQGLIEAHQRGVQVRVVLDESQRTDKYSSADFLSNYGVETYIDSRHGLAHNKIMIIDSRVVITGSYNFTRAAEEKNAENVVVLFEPAVVSKYLGNWQTHLGHCERYKKPFLTTN